MRAVHFLVLQHGYHGTRQDFAYLVSLLPARAPLVVLEPTINEGFKTDHGVAACAQRLTAYLVAAMGEAIAASGPRGPTPCATGAMDGGPLSPRQPVEVHVSFVAHSMGALIVRASLPELSAALDARYAAVVWDTFCAISGPHVGVRQMPSLLRKRVGDWVGRLLCSTGLRDLYLHTDVVPSLLLEDAYLHSWRRFRRRVLMGVVNDNTVMAYSSVLRMPPEDVMLLQGRKDALAAGHTALEKEREEEEEEGGGTREGCCSSGRADAVLTPAHNMDGLREQQLQQQRQLAAAPLAGGAPSADTALSPTAWPVHVLPRERAIAARILAGAGPFEVYMVDFRPLFDDPSTNPRADDDVDAFASSSRPGTHSDCSGTTPTTPAVPIPAAAVTAVVGARGDSGCYGAFTMPHRAIICKAPCRQPELFGFVSEFVARDIIGVPAESGSDGAEVTPARAEEGDG